MLSCAEFLAEFGDYLEEAASPDVRARLEEHLHECKTCQVIVDSTRKTIRIVTDSDSFVLSAEKVEPIVKDVMARIRDHKGKKSSKG
jgi:protein-arginine kinase activator protein McsA